MMQNLSYHPHARFISHNTQSYYSRRSLFFASVSFDIGVRTTYPPNVSTPRFKEIERIRKLFHDVNLSVSPYDTAWVAMVPDPHSSRAPLFPKCINWLLDNQLHDGSWSLPHHHPLLLKDVLSSALACVLALKRWGIGDDQIDKGVRFIELNFTSASEEYQNSPIGFNIIFPGMLEYARDLNLNLQLEPKILRTLNNKRHWELTRFQEDYSKESQAYLAYVSEGTLKSQNWEMVMKFQRKNGSLFNSPSATAAAVMNVQNPGCLNYLHSVIDKFGPAVPAVYPLDLYARLCLVDSLERLGICRHFTEEIQSVLDDTYRYWLEGDEEIFAETSICAIAFRLLRNHGYDVSADPLTEFLKEDQWLWNFYGGLNDINAILEVYRASEMVIHENESSALKKQKIWSQNILKERIFSDYYLKGLPNQIYKEVENVLKFPSHFILPRVENRRNIEHYNLDNIRILKTSYCSSNFSSKDLVDLAVKDFNHCQLLHREELKELDRWSTKNRLHELKFARQKVAYCSFSSAATIFSPELHEARMSMAKNCVLATVVDDFFDVGGSMEELQKLIELVEKWDVNLSKDCLSEPVKIIFSALHSTISEIGEKAFKWQERNVTGHIIEIWLDLLNAMLKEAEWTANMFMPTLNEYMETAYVSLAMGPIILPSLYFVGPKLSEEVVHHPEMRSLHKLVSTCGRLLNDMRGFEREKEAGKPNALSLRLIQGDVGNTKDAAIADLKSVLENERRELFRLVLQQKGSVVPRACKDVFWSQSRMLHHFYLRNDGYTSEVEMIELVNSIIHEPILPSMVSKQMLLNLGPQESSVLNI